MLSSTLEQWPVSRKSRNFTGHFRVSQFPLYLKNGKDLSHQTSQSFFFLLPLKHVERLTFQNERLAVSQMAFRARKVFGTFEKQAPGQSYLFKPAYSHTAKMICTQGTILCTTKSLQTRALLTKLYFRVTFKLAPLLVIYAPWVMFKLAPLLLFWRASWGHVFKRTPNLCTPPSFVFLVDDVIWWLPFKSDLNYPIQLLIPNQFHQRDIGRSRFRGPAVLSIR